MLPEHCEDMDTIVLFVVFLAVLVWALDPYLDRIGRGLAGPHRNSKSPLQLWGLVAGRPRT